MAVHRDFRRYPPLGFPQMPFALVYGYCAYPHRSHDAVIKALQVLMYFFVLLRVLLGRFYGFTLGRYLLPRFHDAVLYGQFYVTCVKLY